MEKIVIVILGFGGGAFCIIASLLNWNFFFENRRAQTFVKLFGRAGARIFYVILGVFLFFVSLRALNVF